MSYTKGLLPTCSAPNAALQAESRSLFFMWMCHRPSGSASSGTRGARSLGLHLEGEHAVVERCSLATVIGVAPLRLGAALVDLLRVERIGKDRGLVVTFSDSATSPPASLEVLRHLVGCDREGTVPCSQPHTVTWCRRPAVRHAGNHLISGSLTSLTVYSNVPGRSKTISGRNRPSGSPWSPLRDLLPRLSGPGKWSPWAWGCPSGCLQLDIKASAISQRSKSFWYSTKAS